MKQRGPFQGVSAIARFNWPFYLSAAVVVLAAVAGGTLLDSPILRWGSALAGAGAAYFIIGSLGVSHWVYDRSDLYRWGWLGRVMRDVAGRRVIVCHSGFDEVSGALAANLPGAELVVLDHYDPRIMTERSIQRARRLYPPALGTVACPYGKWPVEPGSRDIVFGLLAIHELRGDGERAAWFAEAARCLEPGGRLVIAEHVRDPANFIAFGPGFLHFHSPAAWRHSWEQAGLGKVDEFRITPWVRVFVLARR
jgi:SAM-dependent methyltransferase